MPVPKTFGWVGPGPPDIRDEAFRYSVTLRTKAALPPKIDLSTPPLPAPFEPSFNQGSLGSCGPNTEAAVLVYTQWEEDKVAVMPSRLYLYYLTRVLMRTVGEDSGVYNRIMLKALKSGGWCDESLWPYDISKFREKPPQACYDQAATRVGKIQYNAVTQNLADMKGCLADGNPIIFGFTVYQSLDTDEVDRTGDIPMPRQGERPVGGHDVTLVGFDDETQKFKLKNSWGGWGYNGSGYGFIPYAYATNRQLADDFWTITASGETPVSPTPPIPPIPPAPTPAPTSKVASVITYDAQGRPVNNWRVTQN